MKNILNPKWLFIINTLPIVVLFFIFFGEYNIIKSLLIEENISLWKSFAWTLGILGVLNFSYSVYLTIRKQNVSILYGAVALLCYITFIYLFGFHSDQIIPINIPQWMVSGNIILYVGTFLMPTLAYSVFVIITHVTPETKEHKAWKNFTIAIIIPISWYLFSQIILPLWKPVERGFGIHALIIFIIVGTLIFLFFLIRGVYILAIKKGDIWKKYQLAWKIPLSIVLPLLGLAVNNGLIYNYFGSHNSGIFGNFNNNWFYALAIINGILICLPNLENKRYRISLFIGRSITLAYTFYFFMVFLPFLPLSVIAIIAIGTGFLMLTPLLLFVLHINELSKDFSFLKNYFSKNVIRIVSLLSFLVIPAFITCNYLKDKRVLNETLTYLFSPDYSKSYKINKSSLHNTLEVIKHHKNRNNDGIMGCQIPYLSAYFNWLVLDNLTLSDSKINNIEKIFFGKTIFDLKPENIQNDKVKISKITTKSTYDKSQNAWLSWVYLEITNNSRDPGLSEYATTIDLPEGCWISDYYLYIGAKKEMGILAEKKSAMWVFSQIHNENRDPGILYYLTGNKVAFRVFPFAQDEVRKTGIEFLHKEPIKLTIDSNIIELGEADVVKDENFETQNLLYISAKQKQSLKKVKRKPYFHFLVDASLDKSKNIQEFTHRIEQICEKHKKLAVNAEISFVNSYITSFPLQKEWKQMYKSQTFEGGFYLDRAIKTALFHAYKNNRNSYPVIVVVTDNIQNAILDRDFSDIKFAFPESNIFFNLHEDGFLKPHSLTSNPNQELSDTVNYSFDQSVFAYMFKDNSVAYLPYNNAPGIILKTDIFETAETEIKEKKWQSALTMQGKWISQILHPETSDQELIKLVKYSFISKVMTPVTSYLVVENEAQKAILKKKQEQVLKSNKSLDLGDDPQRMNEPSLLILTILLGLILCYKEKRKRQYAK